MNVHSSKGIRAFPFRGISNFRDLGGYPADTDRTVKYGLIFRSGGPIVLTDQADQALFRSLSLKTVLDLRSIGEQMVYPDQLPENVSYSRVSAMYFRDGSELDFSDTGQERMEAELAVYHGDKEAHFTSLYQEMPFHNPAFRTLFDMLENKQVPLVFHCSAGRDRTGVAAMLVLLALGASPETVLEDYMITNRYVQGVRMAAHRRLAEQALSAIIKRYGSYNDFFYHEYGLSQEKIHILRDFYLQKADTDYLRY